MGIVFEWVGLLGTILALTVAFGIWIYRVVITRAHWQDIKLFSNETLGLPKGAVRTFLLLIFVSLTIYVLFAPGVIPPEDKKWVIATLGAIISFYFTSKIGERK